MTTQVHPNAQLRNTHPSEMNTFHPNVVVVAMTIHQANAVLAMNTDRANEMSTNVKLKSVMFLRPVIIRMEAAVVVAV